MILQTQWFNDPDRKKLKQLVETLMERQTTQAINRQSYEAEDQQALYMCSVAGGQTVCYQLLKYLLIDPVNTKKPWVARTNIDKPLVKKHFIAYIDDLVQWLNRQPPSLNYSALVHTQTILNLLTKLEIQDG